MNTASIPVRSICKSGSGRGGSGFLAEMLASTPAMNRLITSAVPP